MKYIWCMFVRYSVLVLYHMHGWQCQDGWVQDKFWIMLDLQVRHYMQRVQQVALAWHSKGIQELGNLGPNVDPAQLNHPLHHCNNYLKVQCLIRRQEWWHIHPRLISKRERVRGIVNQCTFLLKIMLKELAAVPHSLLDILGWADGLCPYSVCHLNLLTVWRPNTCKETGMTSWWAAKISSTYTKV